MRNVIILMLFPALLFSQEVITIKGSNGDGKYVKTITGTDGVLTRSGSSLSWGSGSSPWTIVGSDIYRNSGVSIGKTTAPDARLESLSASGAQLRLSYSDATHYTNFTTTSAGNLAVSITGSQYDFSDDLDKNFTFGRARLSYPASDNAAFSHRDMNGNGNVAIRQSATGRTVVNTASGQILDFTQNNVIIGRFNASQEFIAGGSTDQGAYILQCIGDAIVTGRLRVGASDIVSGSGSPEGSVTAPVGSMYMRSDGGASTSLYVKESGVGNTGWIPK